MIDELKLTILKLVAAYHGTTDGNVRYYIRQAVEDLAPNYVRLFP